jgi:hypothetical protein
LIEPVARAAIEEDGGRDFFFIAPLFLPGRLLFEVHHHHAWVLFLLFKPRLAVKYDR